LQKRLIAATLGRLPQDEVAALDRLLVRWRDIVRDLPQDAADLAAE
jgi:hypothetical protein